MKKKTQLFFLILISHLTFAQMNGNWKGQAQSAGGLSGVANIKINVNGQTITGNFETQMNGLIKVYFEGNLQNQNNATCLGYIDNQPGLTLVLQRDGQNLGMSLYNGQTLYLNAVFQQKKNVGNTGAIVSENIVGTWKFEESGSNTKTTQYWKITDEGFLDGSENTFFMTGYGRSGTNFNSESNNNPIPWIQNFNAMGGRIYTKAGKELWAKAPGKPDEKLFDYVVSGDRLLFYFGGKKKNGEKVGL